MLIIVVSITSATMKKVTHRLMILGLCLSCICVFMRILCMCCCQSRNNINWLIDWLRDYETTDAAVPHKWQLSTSKQWLIVPTTTSNAVAPHSLPCSIAYTSTADFAAGSDGWTRSRKALMHGRRVRCSASERWSSPSPGCVSRHPPTTSRRCMPLWRQSPIWMKSLRHFSRSGCALLPVRCHLLPGNIHTCMPTIAAAWKWQPS